MKQKLKLGSLQKEYLNKKVVCIVFSTMFLINNENVLLLNKFVG